jgi:GTP-binding protein
MTEGNFVDYVKMHVTSGNGGKGSTHLHREKYIAKGGPDGGDGGRGGHVIIKGNSNLWTLLHLKFKRHIKAGHGAHGSSGRSTGADGDDAIIEVPLGTVVRDTDTNDILLKSQKMVRKKLLQKAVKEVVETGILKVLPIKHQDMPSQAFLWRKKISHLN